jgi:hypothetical protein
MEIAPDRWIPFLAEFTRENRGAHARLEVVGADRDVGYRVETENRPFDGIAADTKDGERVVWISLDSGTGDHITHGVHQATVVRVLPASEARGAVLEVEAADGTKTILELTLPEEVALPPANSQ